MANSKFAVMVNGVLKEYTAAEYSSSYGVVGTHESSGEGKIFGGRYSDSSFVKSGSGVIDVNGYGQAAPDKNVELGGWDSRIFVSQSNKL